MENKLKQPIECHVEVVVKATEWHKDEKSGVTTITKCDFLYATIVPDFNQTTFLAPGLSAEEKQK